MKFANCYNAKGFMPYVRLIIIFEHDQLIKNLARPELVAGKPQVRNDRNLGRYRRNTGDQDEKGRKQERTTKMEEGNYLKNRNTEDGVILRGRECNILLMPKIFCKYKGYCTCFW